MDVPFTSLRARRRLFHAAGWVVAAGMLSVALLAPGTVSAAGTWATITGYALGTSANDQAATWGADCTKVDVDDNDDDDGSFVLAHDYRLVVARADDDADEEGTSTAGHANANTVFENPLAGQTVWADSNGSGDFDYVDDSASRLGDDEIDHVILCGPSDTTTSSTSTTTSTKSTTSTSTQTSSTSTTSTRSTTTTSTTTSTSSSGQLGAVGTPAVTPPATDRTSVASAPVTDNGWRIVLFGLAVLLVLVLLNEPKTGRSPD